MSKQLPPNGLDKIMSGQHPAFMLSKLTWETRRLIESRHAMTSVERIWHSMNCAISSWHCHEWYWRLADPLQKWRLSDALSISRTSSVADFGVACQRANRAVRLTRQIATATKHLDVRYNAPEVRTEVWAHTTGEDTRHAVYIFDGDHRYLDLDVYAEAQMFWTNLAHRAKLVSLEVRLQTRELLDAASPMLPISQEEFDAMGFDDNYPFVGAR